MSISLIAAFSINRVIGKDNQLPWYLPRDLAWFKRQTLHKAIVMGRHTYESIGFALPNRRNFVLSRYPFSAPNVTHCVNIAELLQHTQYESEVMVIGGAQLYQQFLPYCQRLYLTHVTIECAGDTFFPEYQQEDWEKIFEEQHHVDTLNPYACRFEILTKKDPIIANPI